MYLFGPLDTDNYDGSRREERVKQPEADIGAPVHVAPLPPPPYIFAGLPIFFILKDGSAIYKTLDFGPRCQENAYLALF